MESIAGRVKIQQYLHWSTIDNLEWILGYTKAFGLIENNPITGERKLRNSAYLYRDIATSGQIDVEKLCQKYLFGEQKENAYQITEKMIRKNT